MPVRILDSELRGIAEAYVQDEADRAEFVASVAHQGQTRRDGCTPYVYHVLQVASRVDTQSERMVAYLHDVLEDTEVSEAQLRRLFPGLVVDAVVAMTHLEGESYDEYLDRVLANPLARVVKRADIETNLADDPTERQVEKYTAALKRLRPA